MELTQLLQKMVEEERKRLEIKLAQELRSVANQAISDLEAKGKVIKEQLQNLAQLEIPKDLLSYYLETGGKVWASKKVNVNYPDDVSIRNSSDSLTYNQLNLPRGTYRLVLLAIPQKEVQTDDYGHTLNKRDC